MPSTTWSATKAKLQLRLSVQRLRTLQQKKEAQAKSARRDIALLLEKGKIESARVKVEALINEDVTLELLELLELYCELLIARFGLFDQGTREPDPGISEGVCAIIYAAPRTEVKELQILREFLMHKYGREFSIGVMENRQGCVSDRVSTLSLPACSPLTLFPCESGDNKVMKKLVVETPLPTLVEAYLTEIAKGYGINWSSLATKAEASEGVSSKDPAPTAPAGQQSGQLPAYSEDGSTGEAPGRPDVPSTGEDLNEKRTPSVPSIPGDGPEDDFEALARRFQALKKH
ncbi:DUF292-domain-containing protein [Pisolithus croceorrhizus]|nr:DUF292-domain-containing protein [Pisolithus croceorrhizus]